VAKDAVTGILCLFYAILEDVVPYRQRIYIDKLKPVAIDKQLIPRSCMTVDLHAHFHIPAVENVIGSSTISILKMDLTNCQTSVVKLHHQQV